MVSLTNTPSSVAPILHNYQTWFDAYVQNLPTADANQVRRALALAEAHYPDNAMTANGEPV